MIINSEIKDLVNEYIYDKNKLVVLKGFSKSLFNQEDLSLENLFSNKKEVLQRILSGENLISYEEFLFFKHSLLELFEEVYILNNSFFNHMYPMHADIPSDVLGYLLEYFAMDYEPGIDDYEHIEKIEGYLSVYGGCQKINNNYFVVYTEPPGDTQENITVKDVYKKGKKIKQGKTPGSSLTEIINEEDYIKFLTKIQEGENYYVKKFGFGLEVFAEKLELISYYKNVNIYFSLVEEHEKDVENYGEYLGILKKYWQATEFLNIDCYDLKALEDKIKKIKKISQAEIIDVVVKESEKAQENELFTDIFVTAPTGAGKSVMFQIPAIYLGEKHGLITIVISPLIGLMNDQIKGLEKRNYHLGKTIHSDITMIKRQEIIDDVSEGKCHILYISPETLLSRSDISQLIGNRKIGLFVVDEAHIVTTWGKQFRPDYWFLGDKIKKIRKEQEEKYKHSFPIATFTATAIYGGIEDMYSETKDSLHMPNPITYLGYVKRDNIEIKIREVEAKTKQVEYQVDKFESILININSEIYENRKTVVYFPTVRLVNSFYEYLKTYNRANVVARYHGQMNKYEKEENYQMFYSGDKKVMLATKAFGMGIDIDDILTIIHFAPTGNVCDYVQEIGRAARKKNLLGKAYYEFMSNDFKYINRFHGLALIKEIQLVRVIEKIYDLYMERVKSENAGQGGRKKSMLLDAENFSHIFQNEYFDIDDAINKVKTAMLIIQKDYENKFGYSPIYIRPVPIFRTGYFQVDDKEKMSLVLAEYGENCLTKESKNNIIEMDLGSIWGKKYRQYTFPHFKYLLYNRSSDLNFKYKEYLTQALILDIKFTENYRWMFQNNISALEEVIYSAVKSNKYHSEQKLVNNFSEMLKVSEFKSQIMVGSFLTTMKYFAHEHNKGLFNRMFNTRENNANQVTYQFKNSISNFFRWIKEKDKMINGEQRDGRLYIANNQSYSTKEILLFLGFMESFDFLSFKSLGGNNSQIYIYIAESQTLSYVKNRPFSYENNILKIVDRRHKISVQMLKYLFSGELMSDVIWNYLEDYFLGIIPEEVLKELKTL